MLLSNNPRRYDTSNAQSIDRRRVGPLMQLVITLSDVYWAMNFILPSYAANSIPALFGGGRALDFERKLFDGGRIFGEHKTVNGLISGLLAGTTIATLESLFVRADLFLFGVIASLGALGGDLVGAFIKRRLKLPPGYALPLLDQLDFVFGGLGLLSSFYVIEIGVVFLVFLMTPIIHLVGNMIAYISKTKDVFW